MHICTDFEPQFCLFVVIVMALFFSFYCRHNLSHCLTSLYHHFPLSGNENIIKSCENYLAFSITFILFSEIQKKKPYFKKLFLFFFSQFLDALLLFFYLIPVHSIEHP